MWKDGLCRGFQDMSQGTNFTTGSGPHLCRLGYYISPVPLRCSAIRMWTHTRKVHKRLIHEAEWQFIHDEMHMVDWTGYFL